MFSDISLLSMGRLETDQHGACWEWIRFACFSVQTRTTSLVGSRSLAAGESFAVLLASLRPKRAESWTHRRLSNPD